MTGTVGPCEARGEGWLVLGVTAPDEQVVADALGAAGVAVNATTVGRIDPRATILVRA